MAKKPAKPCQRDVDTVKDELGGEVAIRMHVDQFGLTVAGRSRFLTATDRLFGGLVGIPASYFEGIRQRREIKENTLTEQVRLEHSEVIKRLNKKGEIGKAAAQRLANEEIHKQINLEAVWVATDDAIQQTYQTEKTDASNEASELNEDWLNYFISHAEKASSANLRKLWGQILAREIRKPGSSSLSALRVLSEMDAELAGAFQEVMIRRIASDAILRPDAREGQALVKITTLLETGLLFDNALGLSLKMSGVPGSVRH